MGLLLVDDRDGRILAEVTNADEAQQVLESLWGDAHVPDYLCLVEIRSHHRAIVGTDSSVKVRPLT
jgi:hypothetical protein